MNQFNTKAGVQARGAMLLKASVAAALAVAGVGAAHAADDDALTWKGITLYGIVDIGLQYQTHGAPINDYFPAGSADIVQKNSNKSTFGATPSNMAQSRVGLQGKESLGVGDWSAVFKLETFFNPQSGNISDGLKSVAQNNGRALNAQTTNIDTSVAGQAFQQAFAGFSSPTFGTITFGRQNTLLADGVAKYDPNYASQAFSVIGLSGFTAGAGDTQNRRLDSSLKYTLNVQNFHGGLQYKFNGANGGAKSTVFEAQLGGEYLGFSADAYYVNAHDAIGIGPLSAQQVAQLPTLGYSVNNSLSGTISDNTSYSVMASYKFQYPVKLFAGYENIKFKNPATPLPAGTDDIGGYVLAFVSNTAFPNPKTVAVYWAGARYTVIPNLDLVGAYYGYHQDAFASGALAGCSSNVSGACSGTLDGISFDADYYMTKRFDVYAGIMYTGVKNGLANGYLHTTDMNPTIGVRYKF